jgi:uncharacterized membrane protein
MLVAMALVFAVTVAVAGDEGAMVAAVLVGKVLANGEGTVVGAFQMALRRARESALSVRHWVSAWARVVGDWRMAALQRG